MHSATPSAAPLLVFDLDGTLVDTLDDLTASANRLLAQFGRMPIDRDEVRAMVGDGVTALVRRVLASTGPDAGPDRDGAAIRFFLDDYERRAANTSLPFSGVPETLARLHAEGWRLAVCTNKPREAARVLLAALGLEPLLAAIGGGDSFATRKPDPGHLLGTIEAAGGSPDRAVMVGDHANDVAAARAAGVPCVFALWGYGPAVMAEGCTARAQSIHQIPALAAALLERPAG